ncbi:hypothetical protein GCM10023222_50800 [Saccharopolyspora cebuensis]
MEHGTLRKAVLDRLDDLDRVATDGAVEMLLPVARAELPRLAESMRALLRDHRPDSDGRCRNCLVRARPWPCRVWSTAHRQLVVEHSAVPHRRALRLRRAVEPTAVVDPVLPEVQATIVTEGGRGPSDWDTEEFTRPELTTPPPNPTPVGGHLETAHEKIHRASVVDRDIRWPP